MTWKIKYKKQLFLKRNVAIEQMSRVKEEYSQRKFCSFKNTRISIFATWFSVHFLHKRKIEITNC